MKRIMVTGISAGAGKSTFARELGNILRIDVYHLDTFFWKPGWVQASIEEFSETQMNIVREPEWIIEGNYKSTYEIRAERADTIIYLELPLLVCLYRVFKRWYRNRGRTRPDLGEGCPEKIDWAFLKFICTTYYPRKRKMAARFKAFQSVGSQKTLYQLKGKQEIRSFLEALKKPSEN